MALEPITRQEKIIAGRDLTPITRMEKFLKEYGGGSGSGGGNILDTNGKLLNSVLPEGYPYEKEGLAEVVAEHSVQVTVEEKYGFIEGQSTLSSAIGAIANLVNHEEDLVVLYDGVEYICKVVKTDGLVGVGNFGLGGFETDYGSNLPFYIVAVAEDGVAAGYLTTLEAEGSEIGSTVTHTLACYKHGIIPVPIDPKFLPAVVITSTTSGITINCAYGDFWNYTLKGVPVIYDYVTNNSRYYAHSFVQEDGWIRIVTPTATFAFSEDGTIDLHVE